MAAKRLFWWSGSGTVVALAVVLLAHRAFDGLRDDRAFFTRTDLVVLSEELKLYKEHHGSYPSSEQGLEALLAEGRLHELPRDFWHHDYVYRFPSARDRSTFDLFSLGPDGVESRDDIRPR
jgi:general secretion pathway protein G